MTIDEMIEEIMGTTRLGPMMRGILIIKLREQESALKAGDNLANRIDIEGGHGYRVYGLVDIYRAARGDMNEVLDDYNSTKFCKTCKSQCDRYDYCYNCDFPYSKIREKEEALNAADELAKAVNSVLQKFPQTKFDLCHEYLEYRAARLGDGAT